VTEFERVGVCGFDFNPPDADMQMMHGNGGIHIERMTGCDDDLHEVFFGDACGSAVLRSRLAQVPNSLCWCPRQNSTQSFSESIARRGKSMTEYPSGAHFWCWREGPPKVST
jgi:hypothetical protein